MARWGCPDYARVEQKKLSWNWDDLKIELQLLHEDKYDYSQTIYTGMNKHFI